MSNNESFMAKATSVDPAHDVFVHPYRWKLSSGSLIQKAELTLSVSGSSISAVSSAAASGKAREVTVSPIDTSVVLSMMTFMVVPVVGGIAALASAPAAGTQVQVMRSDPTYYSEPVIVT